MSAVLISSQITNGNPAHLYSPAIEIDFGKIIQRTNDDDFLEFARRNESWLIEMSKNGDLIIMPGTGGMTGKRNSRISRRLDEWAEKDGSGVSFNSETYFSLPNGARRMPDSSWISNEKWNSLTEEEKEKIIPFAPHFVIELRSPSDSLNQLREKMKEYAENGVLLGWLIDPKNKRVYIYRPNVEPEMLENITEVSGESLLKDFVLNLREIWD